MNDFYALLDIAPFYLIITTNMSCSPKRNNKAITSVTLKNEEWSKVEQSGALQFSFFCFLIILFFLSFAVNMFLFLQSNCVRILKLRRSYHAFVLIHICAADVLVLYIFPLMKNGASMMSQLQCILSKLRSTQIHHAVIQIVPNSIAMKT